MPEFYTERNEKIKISVYALGLDLQHWVLFMQQNCVFNQLPFLYDESSLSIVSVLKLQAMGNSRWAELDHISTLSNFVKTFH